MGRSKDALNKRVVKLPSCRTTAGRKLENFGAAYFLFMVSAFFLVKTGQAVSLRRISKMLFEKSIVGVVNIVGSVLCFR